MTETKTEETRLIVSDGRDAAHVDTGEMRAVAELYMTHAGGLFPKDMTPRQAGLMARLSLAYGLDPMANELILFQGNPLVTYQGRVRKAQEHPAYDGLECAPATDKERKDHRVADDEHFYIARVWRKDRRIPFTGYGRAAGKADANPVSKTWGQEMAQKRAKSRALRDAFAMPLPDFEDAQPDRPPVEYVRSYDDAPRGPVIEGESRVITDADLNTGELPTDADGGISASQVTKIHTLVSVMKMDEDEYRGLLQQAFGVDSSLELSEGQAAAFSECLESVLANAQEEGRAARVDEIVERMKASAAKFRSVSDDDDPSWQRTKQRDAERKAALDQAGFEPPAEDHGVEAAANVIYHEPSSGELKEPAEKSTRRLEMESRITQYMAAGSALGIDLAPYQFDETTPDGALEAKGVKLSAAIRKLTEQTKQAATA